MCMYVCKYTTTQKTLTKLVITNLYVGALTVAHRRRLLDPKTCQLMAILSALATSVIPLSTSQLSPSTAKPPCWVLTMVVVPVSLLPLLLLLLLICCLASPSLWTRWFLLALSIRHRPGNIYAFYRILLVDAARRCAKRLTSPMATISALRRRARLYRIQVAVAIFYKP